GMERYSLSGSSLRGKLKAHTHTSSTPKIKKTQREPRLFLSLMKLVTAQITWRRLSAWEAVSRALAAWVRSLGASSLRMRTDDCFCSSNSLAVGAGLVALLTPPDSVGSGAKRARNSCARSGSLGGLSGAFPLSDWAGLLCFWRARSRVVSGSD